MFYSCLCANFMSCWCVLMEKIAHFSRWVSNKFLPPTKALRCGLADCCKPGHCDRNLQSMMDKRTDRDILHKPIPVPLLLSWQGDALQFFCVHVRALPQVALVHGGENNGWVLICSVQNCIFLLGDSREVSRRITSKFCDNEKDTFIYIVSNFQLNSHNKT